ncbi:MAG: molybdopterin cofactor-binding domain-containing protein, partial [Clostridia bacterium]
VLMRGTICAAGVYTIPNLHVQGRAVKTNSVPNGAFRGFGGPQVFFSIEMFMAHIARRLKEDEVQFKLRHVARQGDITSTGGQYHFPVVVPEMTARILEMSGYVEKRKRYAREIGGRYRWGIGFALALHGCGFTGNGERDIIQAVARLRGLADGKVEILVGNTEMGQGLQTTFAKLVSERMGLPMECILLREPDTDRVSDAGPTVASRSIMVVGQLLLRACDELKAQWKPGQEITVETHYEHPPFMIPFDAGKLQGDAYPDFSWSANVVEVEVDTLTAEIRVLDAWGVYDVGVPVDRQIVQGQMQGGLVQAIGYGSTEKMSYNDKGVIRNDHLSDYILPTAMDVGRIEVDFVINPYPYGPLGAKGAGELPHVGGAPAYLAAVENALHTDLSAIPFSAEDAMQVLRKGGEIS